jgi:hypothetical protein
MSIGLSCGHLERGVCLACENVSLRASVEKLRATVRLREHEHLEACAELDEARAEAEGLREVVKLAQERLRACGHELTEFSYQELASVLFDCPTPATPLVTEEKP